MANGAIGQKPVDNKSVNGAKFDGIADVLHKYKPTYTSALIQPRGLVNNGNMCFMNAVSAYIPGQNQKQPINWLLKIIFAQLTYVSFNFYTP